MKRSTLQELWDMWETPEEASTLSDPVRKRRFKPRPGGSRKGPPLTLNQVMDWALRYFDRHGKYPTHNNRPQRVEFDPYGRIWQDVENWGRRNGTFRSLGHLCRHISTKAGSKLALNYLRRFREASGLDLALISQVFEMTQEEYEAYEFGRAEPTYEAAQTMANFHCVRVANLFPEYRGYPQSHVAYTDGPWTPNDDEHQNLLPPIEKDIYILYHQKKWKQDRIAQKYGMTQAAISYRLSRINQRLTFLRKCPEFLTTDEDDLRAGLKKHLKPKEVNSLVAYWKTTSQSEAAKLLGLSQGRVRYHIVSAIEKLQGSDYHRLFSELFAHKNIMHEVILHPHQKERAKDLGLAQ